MNYGTYIFTMKERVLIFLEWCGIAAVIAYFFYKSIWAFVGIAMLLPLYFKWKRKQLMKKRKWELTIAFREAVGMVAANLQTGNSIENAFRRTYGDLKSLYGESADIVSEFYVIGKGLDNNLVLENLLTDFANRSGVEDIQDFTDIFVSAKRTGGNLREIISDTVDTISEKIEMKRELRILISEKQFEQKIMCLIPFFILAYIGFTSPGYFDSLYHNLSGIGIMTACLVGYFAALLWGIKITTIDV